jgi:hypothetical protein
VEVGGRLVVVGGWLVVVPVVDPLHTTPFMLNVVGAGLLALFQEPLKPNSALAFVARLPL